MNATRDPLIGMYFTAALAPTLRASGDGYQGRVQGRAGSGDYLVQLFSWWDGCPTKSILFDAEELRQATFFPSAISLQARFGCPEIVGSDYCGRDVTHVIRLPNDAESPRCKRCADFYAGEIRAITTADFDRERPEQGDALLAIAEELANDLREELTR